MTEATQLKIHYQTLKARCLEAAVLLQQPALADNDAAVVAQAKRFYNEITGQDWSGADVEGA